MYSRAVFSSFGKFNIRDILIKSITSNWETQEPIILAQNFFREFIRYTSEWYINSNAFSTDNYKGEY